MAQGAAWSKASTSMQESDTMAHQGSPVISKYPAPIALRSQDKTVRTQPWIARGPGTLATAALSFEHPSRLRYWTVQVQPNQKLRVLV